MTGNKRRERDSFICIQASKSRYERTWGLVAYQSSGENVFARENACMCRRVCTYAASRVPTSKTKELRNVLEVSRASVVKHTVRTRITVAVELVDALGLGALGRVARS
jgi:hypothetical protein